MLTALCRVRLFGLASLASFSKTALIAAQRAFAELASACYRTLVRMARVDYRVRPPSAGSWGSHPKTAKRRLICCCCCCCCCILPPLIFLIVFLAGVSGPLQAMQESGRGLEVCAVTLCSDAGASCPESTSPADTTIRMLIDFRFYNPTIITANLLSADFAITLDGQTEVTPGGSADASVAAGALIACALPDEASLPSKDWGTVSVYCEFAEHNAPAEQLNTDPSIGVMANGHVGVHAVVPFEQAVSMRVKVDHEMLKIFEQRAAGSATSDDDADDGSQVPTPTLPSPRMPQQADAAPPHGRERAAAHRSHRLSPPKAHGATGELKTRTVCCGSLRTTTGRPTAPTTSVIWRRRRAKRRCTPCRSAAALPSLRSRPTTAPRAPPTSRAARPRSGRSAPTWRSSCTIRRRSP